MKWTIIDPHYRPFGEGTWSYVRAFSRALRNKGIDVHIISITNHRRKAGRDDVDGITLHRLYAASPRMGPFNRESKRALTEYVLHLHAVEGIGLLNPHSVFSLRYDWLPEDIRVVQTVSDLSAHRYLRDCGRIFRWSSPDQIHWGQLLKCPFEILPGYLLERRALRRSERIVVMSGFIKKSLCRFYPGIDSSRVITSRAGCGEEAASVSPQEKASLRSRFGCRPETLALLTIVRGGQPPVNLLKALRIFLDRHGSLDLKLFIIGEEMLTQRFFPLLGRLDLQERVQLVAPMNEEELIHYYHLADLFIAMEDPDGLEINSLKALRCDLPVLGLLPARRGEAVRHFHPELIPQDLHPQAIAQKLNYFIEHRDDYHHLQHHSLIGQLYDWNQIVDEILYFLSSRDNHVKSSTEDPS